MKLLSVSDLAKALGTRPQSINVYINRNKLKVSLVNGKKMIDLDKDENRIFIDRYCLKNHKTFNLSRIYEDKNDFVNIVPSEDKKVLVETDTNEIINVDESASGNKKSKKRNEVESLSMKEMRLKVKKLENENKYKELQIQKLQGMLIPTELASHISLYAIDVFTRTFTQSVKSLTSIYAQRFGVSHNQFVDLQQSIIRQIHEITKEAKDNVLKGIAGAVKEYSEVRSRGEKKII